MKVVLLHGFTSSLECVNGLVPRLERAGFEYAMPTLRGHGSRPEDLLGVTWRDWLEDGREALLGLQEAAVVVGLSMGGLVALNLAAEHPTRVVGVATVAAALRFRSPLFRLMPIFRRLLTYWHTEPDYADPELARGDSNYRYFPVETLASLDHYRSVVEDLLPIIRAPVCTVASTQDPVVPQRAAELIVEKVSSDYHENHWFHESRHEMMRDVEREAVFEVLLRFIQRIASEEPFRAPLGPGKKP